MAVGPSNQTGPEGRPDNITYVLAGQFKVTLGITSMSELKRKLSMYPIQPFYLIAEEIEGQRGDVTFPRSLNSYGQARPGDRRLLTPRLGLSILQPPGWSIFMDWNTPHR